MTKLKKQPEPVHLDPVRVAASIGGKATGNQIRAHAPGHTKGAPELDILIDPTAPRGLLVRCFSGEDPVEMKDWILRQCGEPDFAPTQKAEAPTAHISLVKPKDAPKRFFDGHLTRQGYKPVAEYDYATADGEVLFQVVRYEGEGLDKTFMQRRPDGRGGWLSGRPDPILYRWPELAARPAEPIYVVEGEKDADTLAAAGLLATTAPNGSWPDDLSALKGRKVLVLADNDEAGRAKAEKAIDKLAGLATIKRVDLPDLPPKGDVSDWFAAGNTVEQLQALAKAAPPVAANQNSVPRILSSAELVRGFVPPDYHLDGIAQKGFIYSMTAATGTGKTAVLLLIAKLTAEGGDMSGREVSKGRVVYFAGENPDDITMRWIGMAHEMGFDLDTIDAHFIKDRFSVPEALAAIRSQVDALGGASLIVVDTSAAYFHGTDENGNTELGKHARDLRMLTTLPGRPCVMVACHPTKNATSDNLLPRGGGAFIAEMDGNLTLAKSEGIVNLHWQGKHRGPDFEPIAIELKTITAPRLKDSRGRDIPTVMAKALTKGEAGSRAASSRRDEDDVLLLIVGDGGRSLADMASTLQWTRDGNPHKDRVRHATDKLKRQKLVTYEARKWKVTAAGHDALVDIRAERHRAEVAARSAETIVRNGLNRSHDDDDD
jgi:AAA domain-containing protein